MASSKSLSLEKLNGIKGFIFDMDGVFRCGNKPIKGANDLVQWITRNNYSGCILTNECRYTSETIRKDLNDMGITLPEDWSIYNAGMAVRDFLDKLNDVAGVFVIGEQGLKDTIGKKYIRTELPESLEFNSHLFVIIGSTNKLNPEDLESAIEWIRSGARVITTCPDTVDPSSKGELNFYLPNTIVSRIKKMIPCNYYYFGKPNPIMMRKGIELIKEQNSSIKKSEMIFVGDTIDTDTRSAFEAGIKSALVLTGNSNMTTLMFNIVHPDFIFHSVKEIRKMFEKRDMANSQDNVFNNV